MTRAAGRLLTGLALLHFAAGLWLGRGALASVARAGYFDALAISSARQLWFWHLVSAVPLAALGLLLARGEAAPRSAWLGILVALLAAAGACLLPRSGFWLLFLPAALLVRAGRRGRRIPTEWRREGFTVSTDPARLDRAAIRDFLAGSYWAAEIPQEVVDRSVAGSLAFGLFDGDRQIGFARVITDRATFAYIADVYVLEAYRGRGLGVWMMEIVRAHPELAGLRRWMLVTRDAHALYRKSGFSDLAHPDRVMEIVYPDLYRRSRPADAPPLPRRAVIDGSGPHR